MKQEPYINLLINLNYNLKKIKNYGALHGWITLILKVMDLLIYVFINYLFFVFEIIIVFLPPLFFYTQTLQYIPSLLFFKFKSIFH